MTGDDEELLRGLTDLMKSATVAARDVCRNRDAFVSVEFTGVGETVEVAWHVGVRRRRTIGQSTHEYDTADLWGTGGSLEDALKNAQQAMNPRGGRRK